MRNIFNDLDDNELKIYNADIFFPLKQNGRIIDGLQGINEAEDQAFSDDLRYWITSSLKHLQCHARLKLGLIGQGEGKNKTAPLAWFTFGTNRPAAEFDKFTAQEQPQP